MNISNVMIGSGLLVLAGAAHAGLTVTPTIVSDYDYRGSTQTAGDPAFQLGINYAHSSGLYVGAWGSNLDWETVPGEGAPDYEIDVYGGFAWGDASTSFGYDVGLLYYTFVDSSEATYYEVYAAVSKGWFQLKYSYSPELFGYESVDGSYLESNATIPLPWDFALTAHAGYNFGEYFDPPGGQDLSYIDWAVGLTKTVKRIVLGLKYIDGSDYPDPDLPKGVFSTDNRLVASIATTFPWSKE